ncbi:MAG: transposase [Vicinamibacterales bacterium]
MDLERRCVVDVLAVRTADAVAAWLAAHPDITIISRDRHGPYAEGVRRGAPQATQVADRFHLVLNLHGAVEQALSQQRPSLIVPLGAPAAAVTSDTPPPSAPPRRRRSAVLAHQQRIAQERRALQLERFALVKRLQLAGRTASAIMRETGIGRASVHKWVRLRDLPTRNQMAPRPGMPEAFRDYLLHRWTEGCHSGRLLMAEIEARGYVGSYAGLAKLLAPWRTPARIDAETPIEHPTPTECGVLIPSVPVRHVSPQIAAALLGQPRALLTERQAQIVDVLKDRCPGFTAMRRVVRSFRTVLRVGTVPTLHRWLDRAQSTGIHALQRFVRTLRQDLGAADVTNSGLFYEIKSVRQA